MIRILKENLGGNQDPKALRWVGVFGIRRRPCCFWMAIRPLMSGLKKSKVSVFIKIRQSVGHQREQWYRQHFPTGTADENASIIRDMMRGAILENELHKEEDSSQNTDVLHQIAEDDKFLAWYDKKFGWAPPSLSKMDF